MHDGHQGRRGTLSFEEAGSFLDDLADSLPEGFFRELNGGIILLPDTKLHPASGHEYLYTIGEYRHEPYGLGRYIVIYYGSFVQVYGRESHERQEEALRYVLMHEFTHHLQNLGGTRELEVEDAQRLTQFRRKQSGNIT